MYIYHGSNVPLTQLKDIDPLKGFWCSKSKKAAASYGKFVHKLWIDDDCLKNVDSTGFCFGGSQYDFIREQLIWKDTYWKGEEVGVWIYNHRDDDIKIINEPFIESLEELKEDEYSWKKEIHYKPDAVLLKDVFASNKPMVKDVFSYYDYEFENTDIVVVLNHEKVKIVNCEELTETKHVCWNGEWN